ncbi:MAG: hypothetical protein RLZZ214_1477, partial [Verrucomicrobiota bacterium]
IATFNSALFGGIGGTGNPITLASSWKVGGIVFDGASVGSYQIGATGGTFTLGLGNTSTGTNGIKMTSSVTAAQIIAAPITIGGYTSSNNTPYYFTNDSSTTSATLSLTGNITANISASRPSRLFLGGSNTGNNIISGNLSNPSFGQVVAVLTKQGAGTWILSGNNTFSGSSVTSASATAGIQINQGVLVAENNNALGSTTGSINNYINNGGTLELNDSSANGSINLSNNLTLQLSSGGTIRSKGNNQTSSIIKLANGAGVSSNLAAVGSLDVFTVGNGANDLTGGAADTVIQIGGSGTVLLGQASDYAGTFSINSGTLKLGNATALGSAASAGVAFGASSTGKLALNGTNATVAKLNSNATVGTPIVENGLAGAATLTVSNTAGSSTYAGVLQDGAAGTLALTKDGASTLILSGTNSHTGGTTITNGTLIANNSSALGSGSVGIASGATLSSGSLSVGAFTLTGGANVVLGGAANTIASSGAVNISGSGNLLSIGGAAASINTYNLLTGTSMTASGISLTGTAVNGLTIALGTSSTLGRTTYAFNSTATALQLDVSGGAFNLSWNGGNANWNTTDANWQKDGVGANIAFFAGDNITISTGDAIAVDGGGVAAGTLVANNATGTATLTGGAVTATSLSKSGAGTLQLDTAISGATLAVSGGVLALGSQNQSFGNVSLTSGSITGTSAVLTGTGSAFDVQSGSISAILGGSIGLNKTTGGTVTLSGANSYTGATLVSAGTLAEGSTGLIADSSALTVDGASAVFDLGANHDDTVAAVSLKNGGSITGSGTSALTGSSYAVESGSVSAILAGAGTLTKTTSGTVTLSGANTYNGGTNVKNGTLNLDGGTNRLLSTGSVVLGDTGTSGKLVLGGTTVADQTLSGLTTTGSGGSVVGGNASNSTLALDIAGTNTFGGTLGGAGTNENNLALTKSGVGTLTLSVANTYAGGTQLNGGTLALGEYRAAGTGTITAVNGTTIAALSGVGGNAVGNAITISGTNANVTLTNNNASGGINSAITGSANQTVTISNAGGTVVNMNSGGKQFQNFLGTVSISSAQSLAFRSTSLNNGGDNTLFEVNGSLSTRNGGNVALGALSGSGTVSMGGSGGNNIWLTYTIGARGTNTDFSGVIQDGDTANGKRVAIVKTGSATQTLSGSNTYTGTTAVNQGTLEISGSGSINTTGGVTVASGSTFRYNSSVAYTGGALTNNGGTITGTGTIGVAVNLDTIADVLAPGNSPGIQVYNANQSWSGFTYQWETNNFTGTTAGTDFDQIGITGTLTLGGTSYGLDLISLLASNAAGNVPNFSDTSRSWTILTTTGGITGFNAGDWTIDSGAFTSSPSWTGTWSLAQSSNDLVLTYAVVPEPNAAMLVGGLGMLALLRRRRG